jgi:hypothetical protein
MQSRIQTIFITAFAVLAFLAAFVGAAWLGIKAATKTLPESVAQEAGPAIGETLSLNTESEPLYLADSLQVLRDFFFAHPSPDKRRESNAEEIGLRRVFEPLEARVLSQDADAFEVEVLDGPLAELRVWIHESQLPTAVSISTRPAPSRP